MKTLIDLGTHFGDGLSKHIEHYGADETWKIHTFEPNIFTFNELKKIREGSQDLHSRYSWLRWKNVNFHNEAAWIEDGFIDFHCCTAEGTKKLIGNQIFDDYLQDVNGRVEKGISVKPVHDLEMPTDAGSTIINPNLLAKEGYGFIQDALEFREKDKIRAKCIDLSLWLKNNFSDEDEIIMKVDIEGAEYFVLEKLINEGIPKNIKEMNIEWHDWYFPNMPVQESKYRLAHSKHFILNSLSGAGIKIGDWV